MLSLYIHIPFCSHKCEYCSFFVLPENNIEAETLPTGGQAGKTKLETTKEQYLQSLLAENIQRHKQFPTEQIRTIYIGGGTPFQLGSERLFQLIDTILETRDCEFLEELSIELNPDPFDEVLTFIEQANQKYQKLYKLRFSIGIQTFDDEILKASKRNYVFNNLISFLRELQQLKQHQTSFNFDFIAFGKNDVTARSDNDVATSLSGRQISGSRAPRDDIRMEFFRKLLNSHLADGYSLYTLELFPGSNRYNRVKTPDTEKGSKVHRLQGNDDAIYHEFDFLKQMIQHAGYKRYEISNFSLRGRPSIHNIAYRTMQPYIGMGINSSSFLPNNFNVSSGWKSGSPINEILNQVQYDDKNKGIRFQNTKHRKKYLNNERLDTESIEPLDDKNYRIEQAFLALRCDGGLKNLHTYTDIFESNREKLLQTRNQEGLVTYDKETDTLKLNDTGMGVYNTLITDLFSSF